jgi:hypothetical protein
MAAATSNSLTLRVAARASRRVQPRTGRGDAAGVSRSGISVADKGDSVAASRRQALDDADVHSPGTGAENTAHRLTDNDFVEGLAVIRGWYRYGDRAGGQARG